MLVPFGIVNYAVVIIGVHVSVFLFSGLLEIYVEMELLDHLIIL